MEAEKEQWEQVYSQGNGKLPWLENPIPKEILLFSLS